MSDIPDGVYPIYVKDGVKYPIALTREQVERLPLIERILGNIYIMMDHPMGKAVNLIKREGESR